MRLRPRTILLAPVLLLTLQVSQQTCSSQTAQDGIDSYNYGGAKLSSLERRGRDTWYFWAAGDQRLWRQIAITTNGATDVLQYADSRRNGRRFRELGALTELGCLPATTPDEYGLWFVERSFHPYLVRYSVSFEQTPPATKPTL